ncbi:MAG: GNAT family N-acetyltransferase [Chloroflexi bacterium]|nr:GNAT family N-acetyltransferase [Chloroflexota bacterium]
MKREYPLTSQQKPFWIDLLITMIGITGVIFFLTFYDRALPNASIDLQYSREQISAKVAEYLHGFGYSPAGYEFSMLFGQDSTASYYLQRKLGIEQTNTLLVSEKLPLYYWKARWFKPSEKEEFFIQLSPQADILSFGHVIKEDAPGAAIPQAQAQKIAEDFLHTQTGWDAAQWERVEASSQAQPGGRVDHTFAWKSRSFAVGEAELRTSVTVQGDQIGSLNRWIKIPESFLREYASERDRAGFINTVCLLFGMLGLFVVALAALFNFKSVDYQRALKPAWLTAVVTMAAYLNYAPLFSYSYATTQNYTLFWVMTIVGAVAIAFFYAFQVFGGWAGGQALAKLVWPQEDRILARGTERWLTFSRSAWRGLMLGGFNLGYIVLFYLLTSRFLGWWIPASSEYSNIFGTPFPFLEAFQVGLNAALTEELLFRFVGITICLWLFGKKQIWLALLIPGALWGFAHSSYVTYPIYARGIELTLEALLLGYIFLKFDLFTTIMAHFSYNMIVVAMPLLRSESPYFRFSGLVVLVTLVLPLLPGIFWKLAQSLGRLPKLPKSLSLAPASAADLPRLAALPVKADWPALFQQEKRIILCLSAGPELAGFATGFVDANNSGQVDGIYVTPRWQRQYWGTRLLQALQEDFQNLGVREFRAILPPIETKPVSFFESLFWKTRASVLAPGDPPTFSANLKEVKKRLKTTWQNFRLSTPKDTVETIELEIPRELL